MRPVRFCFDFLSPYAWLAWQRVHAVVEARCAEVVPTPVLLAALLRHHGTKGPAEVPAKRVYVFKDCVRHAAALGVPLVPPPAHPFSPLLALRVASLDVDAATKRRLVTALFEATWGGGPGVEDPAVVDAIAASVGVPDAVARAGSDDVKARLRAATDQAIAAGVFGVPSLVIDQEVFWGLDSLPHVARYLDGDDAVDAAALSRWAALPATATRA